MTFADMFTQPVTPVADADPELTAALSADFARFLVTVVASIDAADAAADAAYMAGYDATMSALKAEQASGPTLH